VAAVAAASMLRFNAGGHINHSIFWQNLAPQSKCGEPSGSQLSHLFAQILSSCHTDVHKVLMKVRSVKVEYSPNAAKIQHSESKQNKRGRAVKLLHS